MSHSSYWKRCVYYRLKGKGDVHGITKMSLPACWSSSETGPGCVLMPKAACCQRQHVSASPYCIWTSLQPTATFPSLMLGPPSPCVFSTFSVCFLYLSLPAISLWSLHTFTDNLSITLRCFFACTSDSKTHVLSSLEAFLLFHTHPGNADGYTKCICQFLAKFHFYYFVNIGLSP